jgi:hypothetical protein
MSSSRLEYATFRLVSQCLNQLNYGVSLYFEAESKKKRRRYRLHRVNSYILDNFLYVYSMNNERKNSVAFSPQANYTDRATAACRRS